MNTALSPQDAVRQAWALLKQREPPEAALALLDGIGPESPEFARAQHLRSLCAFRGGRMEESKRLLIDAIQRGEQNSAAWRNLCEVIVRSGMPEDALAVLLDSLIGSPADKLFPLTFQLAQVLGFTKMDGDRAGKDAVFRHLLLPLLAALLERRDMDNAMILEIILFENYLKHTETEAHFAAFMGEVAPLFTASGLAWRETLEPLPPPALTAPYRVGFFIHAASMLAHIEVLLNILKGYRLLDEQPFEPIVYCFGGRCPEMEEALAALDVRLVLLEERFPDPSGSRWRRLLRLRELIAADGVQELVWVSVMGMLPLAFSMRLAMKYRNFDHPEIDGYVTGSALTRFGTMAGRRWRMGLLGVDDWYDAQQEAPAAEIRAGLDAPVVLMTLARAEKMHDAAFLGAVAALLQANPQAMFLWAGREESAVVTEAFRRAGVLERTRFIGWVNTRLYAQVADVFLDTFPFPCGFTLYQAMAAGKPVVAYASPEGAQTGLWGFFKPLVEDGEGSAEERAELLTFLGEAERPLIAVARTPEDYVQRAGRLIRDEVLRAEAGAASRRFMARYFSDPRNLGRSMAQHFVELIEERRLALESGPVQAAAERV